MAWRLAVFLIHSVIAAVNGVSISLQPLDLTSQSGVWLSFNCTLQCSVSETHSLYWIMGRDPITTRRFNELEVSVFERNTGMDIALVNVEECPLTGNLDGKHKIQQLRIWSDVQWDGIPVQCAAIRSSPELLDHFSPYAVLSVESDDEVTSVIPTPTIQTVVPTMPDPTSVQCSTQIQEVTRFVTMTETVTSTVTITPTPQAPTSCDEYSSTPTSSSGRWFPQRLSTHVIVAAIVVCALAVLLP